MRAIEAAREHFRSLGTQSVDVPEWVIDGVALRIFFNPLTVWEKRELQKEGKTDADVLVLKARTASGERLFAPEDKDDLLRRCDDAVVRRIAAAMLAAPTPKDMEKN